jgi:hypothetical protein
MKRILLILLLFISNDLIACSCGIGAFDKVVEKSELLVHVKVKKQLSEYDVLYIPEMTEEENRSVNDNSFISAVIADVITNINGEVITEEIVIKGWLCPTAVYVEDLLIDNEYVLSIEKEDEGTSNFFQSQLNTSNGIYRLTPCSEPAAILKDNKLFYYQYPTVGEGTKLEYFMDYDKFINTYKH